MMNRLTFWIAFCVFVFKEISLVQTDDTCKTSEDCSANFLYKFCCGGDSRSVNRARRMCGYYNCLNKYCETKSHCGDPTFCCRSNTCVDRGCYSCRSKLDCRTDQVCCKKSFPSNQTFCDTNCIGAQCNNNDDCAGETECCRDGKCVATLKCYAQCNSNAECNSGKYCCKMKRVWFWQDRCIEKCIGEDCKSNDDCGPPDETCDAGKCARNVPEIRPPKHRSNSKSTTSPPYIIIIAIAVPLVVIGLLVPAGFWCYKRKRASSTTEVNAGTSTAMTNPQHSSQLPGFTNPAMVKHEIGFGQTCENPEENGLLLA